MLGLGHLPELIVILGVGLLVFGPKRMIDMGAAAGKAFREFREATRDLNLNSLTTPPQSAATAEPDAQSTLSKLSQLSQSLSASTPTTSEASAPGAGAGATVDATISHDNDHIAEPTKAE